MPRTAVLLNGVPRVPRLLCCCRVVFQGVHQLLQFSSSAEGAGRPWQSGEKKYCKLVFIGKNLDRKELNDAFNACLVAAA